MSAWRELPTVTPQVQAKLDALKAERSNYGRAKVVGGTVARHFLAQAVGIAGLLAMLAGLVLAGLGVWWR